MDNKDQVYDIDIQELKAIRKAEKLRYKRRIRRLKEDRNHWRMISECRDAELERYHEFEERAYKLLNSFNDFYMSLRPINDLDDALVRIKEVVTELKRIKKERSKEMALLEKENNV